MRPEDQGLEDSCAFVDHSLGVCGPDGAEGLYVQMVHGGRVGHGQCESVGVHGKFTFPGPMCPLRVQVPEPEHLEMENRREREMQRRLFEPVVEVKGSGPAGSGLPVEHVRHTVGVLNGVAAPKEGSRMMPTFSVGELVHVENCAESVES